MMSVGRKAARRRQCRPASEREEYVALFATSGLSAAAFCRRHGLSAQAFHYWRKTAARERPTTGTAQAAPGFAEVTVVPGKATGGICIRLPGAVVVEVADGTDAAWLGRVLRELGARG